MSLVTNAILAFSVLEDEEKLKQVNEFFEGSRGFVSCDDEGLPVAWYGGTKMLEAHLAIGAFNYLDLVGLLNRLRTIEWETPENVQLIVEEQNDVKFRIIELRT